jgi:hypothetical protein
MAEQKSVDPEGEPLVIIDESSMLAAADVL